VDLGEQMVLRATEAMRLMTDCVVAVADWIEIQLVLLKEILAEVALVIAEKASNHNSGLLVETTKGAWPAWDLQSLAQKTFGPSGDLWRTGSLQWVTEGAGGRRARQATDEVVAAKTLKSCRLRLLEVVAGAVEGVLAFSFRYHCHHYYSRYFCYFRHPSCTRMS
jgi:hypothetical protein